MKGESKLARRAIAAGAGAALALAGPATVTRADGPGPDLGRFYEQKIGWEPCEPTEGQTGELLDSVRDMECSTLSVPVDYADPGKGAIALALARIRSAAHGDERKGSVVFNFGGPGESGVDGLAAFRDLAAGIDKHYDLVSFDPRGVARSSPVRCGGEDEAGQLDGEGQDAPGTGAAAVAEAQRVARACHAKTGPVLDHVGTINTSRDMDVLRAVLGDNKLNYLGISYGTRLGAVYASQFPKRTGRMVLDAVDTLRGTAEQDALAQTRGFQQALEAFFAGCAQQNCELGTSPQQVAATFDRAVAKLAGGKTVTGSDNQDFTGDDLHSAVQSALYSQASWPTLSAGIAALLDDDDPTVLAALNPGAGTDDAPASNSDEAMLAINCADDPVRPADPAKAYDSVQRQLTAESPYFGPGSAARAVACAGWPAGTDYIRRIDRPGAPKILVVGGKGDPATPYPWARDTARQLGSGVLLTYEGEGHGAYAASQCVRAKADAFFATGKVPPEGTSCPAEEPDE
ncbi:alpha/beta hydrolase [Streptomyces sp. MBT27]|uniref:alpha/beta hydrolase n=1 Tax=Streptomyces sp. MBT27 TaxID=1488356 RepID=UPI0014204088|nr:alpha/beta hydrolase [Streptomyces sp. MBT27]